MSLDARTFPSVALMRLEKERRKQEIASSDHSIFGS